MKNIYLLGATGSIGLQVLDVLEKLDNYRLVTISVGYNIKRAREIINKYQPIFVSVALNEDMKVLAQEFPECQFGYGQEGLIKAATYDLVKGDEEFLVCAVVGTVGLIPTIEAIKRGRTILLANKETLVVGGEIIKPMLNKYQTKLIPIDSEHSAIWQCMQNRSHAEVSKLIITASGGALRNKSRSELSNITLDETLSHPNWQMGKKITIDSATMVNKGLEVIEAHFLFDMPYQKIETIIHKESIVHSMVEFCDKSIIAHLSNPDMRIPIQYALTYPDKRPFDSVGLDFSKKINLCFEPMDFSRFPLLQLAYQVGESGGLMPTIYNASNEEAVALFIERKISFLEIEKIIFDVVNNLSNIKKPTLEQILQTDQKVREIIRKRYRKE